MGSPENPTNETGNEIKQNPTNETGNDSMENPYNIASKHPILLILTNLANLLKVKSIITLAIIGGVTYGFLVKRVDADAYCGFAGAVITYYFTKATEDNPEKQVAEQVITTK